MLTLLYIIWFLIPLSFFVLALWSKLEQMSGKVKKDNPGDFLKQGVFVLFCSLLSLGLDLYILREFIPDLLPSFIPYGFVQVMLLPIVLLLVAKILGPTKQIRIKEAPKPSQRKQW